MPRDGKERTVEVRIPAGVKDGARVRAAGEGGAARAGAARPAICTWSVRVLPHARFERRGQDLHVQRRRCRSRRPCSAAKSTVPTLAGSTLRLKIPELTAAGRVFRLRGHGMPAVGKPDERGDLYATVDIADSRSHCRRRSAQHYEALRDARGPESRIES